MQYENTINLAEIREMVILKKNFKIKVVAEGEKLQVLVKKQGKEFVFIAARGNIRYYKSPSSLMEFLHKEGIYETTMDLEGWNPDGYYNASGAYRKKTEG